MTLPEFKPAVHYLRVARSIKSKNNRFKGPRPLKERPMTPVKQSTTELFFPAEEATEVSDTVQPPDSLIRQTTSSLTHLCLLLWSITTFVATFIVLFYAVTDMGIVPPGLLEQPVLVHRSARLRAAESRHHSLEQIHRRLQIIESRLDSVDYFLQPISTVQLDSISSRLEATEAHVQRISTLLEGAQPRNVALWADGARHIKALTSPTYEAKQNSVLRYVWRAKDISVPPSHVLNGAPSSYCWEFTGSKGLFAARLSEQSLVTSLSIFHAHRRTLSSVAASKAPKSFTLWGLYSENTTLMPPGTISKPVSEFLTSPNHPPGIQHKDRLVSLVNGTYDLISTHTRQYFNTSFSGLPPVDVVVLEVLNNWGANTTCLYGLGVHVEPV